MTDQGADDATGGAGQRIDRWLWHARIVRNRATAQDLAASGRVRVNRTVVDKASRTVRIGDVLTLPAGGQVRVLRIRGLAERRGPASAARLLYDDLAPPSAPRSPSAARPADGDPVADDGTDGA